MVLNVIMPNSVKLSAHTLIVTSFIAMLSFHYTDCRYAECHYAGGHGAVQTYISLHIFREKKIQKTFQALFIEIVKFISLHFTCQSSKLECFCSLLSWTAKLNLDVVGAC